MDYFALMRDQVRRQASEAFGVTVHDPYDCEEDGCRLCREFWLDEKIDRATDEGKETV